MRFKCKIKDLIDDLVDIWDVTEITMDDSGIGAAIVDNLREKGVKVKIKRKGKL